MLFPAPQPPSEGRTTVLSSFFFLYQGRTTFPISGLASCNYLFSGYFRLDGDIGVSLD